MLALCFSPSAPLLASGGGDHLVHVYDFADDQTLFSSSTHTKPVYAVDFSADGKYLASGSRDKSVLVFDAVSGARPESGPGPALFSLCLGVGPTELIASRRFALSWRYAKATSTTS